MFRITFFSYIRVAQWWPNSGPMVAQMRPKYGPNAAQMRPKCGLNAAQMWPKWGPNGAWIWNITARNEPVEISWAKTRPAPWKKWPDPALVKQYLVEKLNTFQYHAILLTHTQNNQLSSWLMSKKEKVMNTNAMLHQIYIHEMLEC